jgi:hypothetical protein
LRGISRPRDVSSTSVFSVAVTHPGAFGTLRGSKGNGGDGSLINSQPTIEYKAWMADYYYFMIQGYPRPFGYMHKSILSGLNLPSAWIINYSERLLTMNHAESFHDRTQIMRATLSQAVKRRSPNKPTEVVQRIPSSGRCNWRTRARPGSQWPRPFRRCQLQRSHDRICQVGRRD